MRIIFCLSSPGDSDHNAWMAATRGNGRGREGVVGQVPDRPQSIPQLRRAVSRKGEAGGDWHKSPLAPKGAGGGLLHSFGVRAGKADADADQSMGTQPSSQILFFPQYFVGQKIGTPGGFLCSGRYPISRFVSNAFA